jgi:hypothetical protein
VARVYDFGTSTKFVVVFYLPSVASQTCMVFHVLLTGFVVGVIRLVILQPSNDF